MLVNRLMSHKGHPLKLPVAVVSFEGTLMSCDVEGWADEWANTSQCPGDDWVKKALANPSSFWTWPMASSCSGSLWERCAVEKPPRHLASIKHWLQLRGSPGLVYVAGEDSSKRNKVVFPALQHLADSCGQADRMMLEEVPHAGHNLHRDAPEAVKAILKKVILHRAASVQKSQSPAWAFLSSSSMEKGRLITLLVGLASASLLFLVKCRRRNQK